MAWIIALLVIIIAIMLFGRGTVLKGFKILLIVALLFGISIVALGYFTG